MKLRLGLLPLHDSAFKSKFASDVSNLCSFCNAVKNENNMSSIFVHFIKKSEIKYLTGILTETSFYNNLLSCTIHEARNLGAYVFYAIRIRYLFINNVVKLNSENHS